MKHPFALSPSRLLALLLLYTVHCTLSTLHCTLSTVCAADIHRFATYNVRYVNAQNGDTGEKLWANRRDYVCQIVKDYDFDIVGMQEVTGNNSDPTTGKSQLQDINDRLPDYECIAYEREDRQYSYNTILYKSSKYTCLEHCSFWLSPNPWYQSSCKEWTGGDIARRCIVAHMRVTATGEEFFFCTTHCNYAPQQAGIEGARVIHEELPPLVGNLPVVLVGDFNMERDFHLESYRAYASILKEARIECDSLLSLPTSNPQVTVTTSNWIPAGQPGSYGTEFDHQFYARMEPVSYHIITEDYHRGITPSDHFPLLVCYRMLAPSPTRYVATDEASLIQTLNQVEHGDTILLDVDSLHLSQSLQLERSICLMGRPSGTILTSTTDSSLIHIPGSASFAGENLRIIHVSSSQKQGGAAICSTGYNLYLDNCAFIHCQALNGPGGAINAQTRTVTVRQCVFDHNQAKAGSALLANGCQELAVLNSSFTNNVSHQQGALWLTSASSTTRATIFQSTFLNNQLINTGALPTLLSNYGGAAIKIQVPNKTQSQAIGIAHCTFINNSTTSKPSVDKFTTAAIDLEGGYVCMMNNLMVANRLECSDYAGYHDVRTSGTIDVWRNSYNLTSSDPLISGWKTNLSACIEGQWQDSLFVPTVTDQYVYHLRSTTLGSYSLCNIPLIQRMCSIALDYDLSQDGVEGNYVRYDQLGNWRDKNACYGSLEYTTHSSFPSVEASLPTTTRKVLLRGQVLLESPQHTYTLSGQPL